MGALLYVATHYSLATFKTLVFKFDNWVIKCVDVALLKGKAKEGNGGKMGATAIGQQFKKLKSLKKIKFNLCGLVDCKNINDHFSPQIRKFPIITALNRLFVPFFFIWPSRSTAMHMFPWKCLPSPVGILHSFSFSFAPLTGLFQITYLLAHWLFLLLNWVWYWSFLFNSSL